MPQYRLYHLNPHNGHIDRAEDFHASDDVEAIHLVQWRRREAPLELWHQGRKVSRFDASPSVFQKWASEFTDL